MTATNLIRTVVLLGALAATLLLGTGTPVRAGIFPGLAAIGEQASLIVPVQRGGGFRAPSYSPPVYRAPSPAPSYRAPTYNAPAYRAPAPTYRAPTYNAPPPQTYRPPPQFRPQPGLQAPSPRPMVQRPGPPAWRIAPPVPSQAIQPGRLQPPSARAILLARPSSSVGSRMATDPRGRIGGWSAGRASPSNRGFALPAGAVQRAADRPRAISAPTPTRPASFMPGRIASPATVAPRAPDRSPRIASSAAAPLRPALRAPTIGTRPTGAVLPRDRGAAMARLASSRQLEAEQRRRLAVASPPTVAELRRGFRGQFTASGQAMVTVRGRLLTVRPSLIGVRAPTRALAIASAARAASSGSTVQGGTTGRGGGPPPPRPTVANDNAPPRAPGASATSSSSKGNGGKGGKSWVMVQGIRSPFVAKSPTALVSASPGDARRHLLLKTYQPQVVELNSRLNRQREAVRKGPQNNGIRAVVAMAGMNYVLADGKGREYLSSSKTRDAERTDKAARKLVGVADMLSSRPANDNLQGSMGKLAERKAARNRQVASEWYKKNALVKLKDGEDPQAPRESRFRQDIAGIDLRKAVEVSKLQKGRVLCQYQISEKRGAFFADCNSTPAQLGILAYETRKAEPGDDPRLTMAGMTVVPKIQNRFILKQDLPNVLKSYAGPIAETWSLKDLGAVGRPSGGHAQYVFPDEITFNDKTFFEYFERLD